METGIIPYGLLEPFAQEPRLIRITLTNRQRQDDLHLDAAAKIVQYHSLAMTGGGDPQPVSVEASQSFGAQG